MIWLSIQSKCSAFMQLNLSPVDKICQVYICPCNK